MEKKETRKISVFVSGRGSNLMSIAAAISSGKLEPVEIALVVSDQPQCAAIQWAQSKQIPVWSKSFDKNSSVEFYNELLDRLISKKIDWIVLAGFMRVLPTSFINQWKVEKNKNYSPIVNIHPSLLPAFRGKDGYSQAFEFGAKVSGVTVHLVVPELDAGPICSQKSFCIQDCRSAMEVTEKGLAIEHELYPKTLQWLLRGEFVLEKTKERICVRQN